LQDQYGIEDTQVTVATDVAGDALRWRERPQTEQCL